MSDLIDALGKNPNAARKRCRRGGRGRAGAGGARRSASSRAWPTTGRSAAAGPAKLAGIWELQAPGRAASRRARRADPRARSSTPARATRAEVYATVSRVLTGYAQSWAKMYREACEATQRARRAVGGGARPADDLPAGASGRAARAHRRVQRGERRGRRERGQRGQHPGLARSLRRRAAPAVGRAPARGSGDARAGGGASPAGWPASRRSSTRAGTARGSRTRRRRIDEARALGYQPLRRRDAGR